ncbi:hypothetical protein [Ruminococcus sp. 210702-SL.1.03]|nr:hypothetical protein [Ruminococcus sp. 210702-SL.1.03]
MKILTAVALIVLIPPFAAAAYAFIVAVNLVKIERKHKEWAERS